MKKYSLNKVQKRQRLQYFHNIKKKLSNYKVRQLFWQNYHTVIECTPLHTVERFLRYCVHLHILGVALKRCQSDSSLPPALGRLFVQFAHLGQFSHPQRVQVSIGVSSQNFYCGFKGFAWEWQLGYSIHKEHYSMDLDSNGLFRN